MYSYLQFHLVLGRFGAILLGTIGEVIRGSQHAKGDREPTHNLFRIAHNPMAE
jgi:hypothetical protein